MTNRDTVKSMDVRIKVKAGAKKESVKALPDGRLEIAVKPKAKAGAANARAIQLAAEHFGVPTSRLRIVRGASSPSKTLSLHGPNE